VGSFGNDYIAGNAGNDSIFGQLGDDVVQGDGSIESAVAATDHAGAARDPGDASDPVGPLTVVASFEAATDGEDYIEGGGGCDVVFGGLGQDDIVGGSSSHFSLADPNNRPDGDDTIFGGAGTQFDRNNGFDPDAGDDGLGADVVVTVDTPFESKHARDADAIAGDNADIIRIVGVNGTDVNPTVDPENPLYVSYQYDDYGGEKIIVRGVRLLDYTPGGPDFQPDEFALEDPNDPEYRAMFGIWAKSDIGGHDEVHGETGDDFVYLGGGHDAGYGDADDDDVIGGWGWDWISGGTGIDGVLGDDGRIFTSRNSAVHGEDLYGVDALLATDPDSRTSQGNVLNEFIYTPGQVQTETINVADELKKSVDLTPMDLAPGADDPLFEPIFADDIVFGGLGKDFLHGGAGDDAMAGGEALEESYAPRIEGSEMDEQGQLRDIVGLVRIDFTRPHNPGNVLLFGDDTNPWNAPNPVQSRLGEFYLYDEYDPRRTIMTREALLPQPDLRRGATGLWCGGVLAQRLAHRLRLRARRRCRYPVRRPRQRLDRRRHGPRPFLRRLGQRPAECR